MDLREDIQSYMEEPRPSRPFGLVLHSFQVQNEISTFELADILDEDIQTLTRIKYSIRPSRETLERIASSMLEYLNQ